jgi:hypothetical protein
MRDKDQNPSTERWLDGALKQYSETEPRPGLEDRVLAKLQAERERRTPSLWWWRPAAAAVTIAVLAVGTWLLRRGPDATRISISNQATALPQIGQPESPIASSVGPHAVAQKPLRSRIGIHVAQSSSVARLEQFPAPLPLSKQEEMLAQYVREHHREATMVARARAELRKQELEEFMRQSPSEQPRDLEQ